MADLRSPAFAHLPDGDLLIAVLRENGCPALGPAVLCDFCSCTPAIRIATSGDVDSVIVRGEQQNDFLMTPTASTSLEKEIYILNLLKKLNFPAAGVLLSGRIMSVEHRDPSCPSFRFFVMEDVPGRAIDRILMERNTVDRILLIQQVARVFAKLHAEIRPTFGFIDHRGQIAGNPTNTLTDHLLALLKERSALARTHTSEVVCDKIWGFAINEIPNLCAALSATGYNPGPRLVLYDSSAGNALVDGNSIRWIDVALAGHFDPMADIAPMIFCMKEGLVEPIAGGTLWEFFISTYSEAGGHVPKPGLLERLLRVHMLNLLLHNIVYQATHHDPARRARTNPLAEMANNLLNMPDASISSITSAITVVSA